MRAAPALSVRIEPSPAARRAVAVLSALAAGVFGFWIACGLEADAGWRWAAAGVAASLGAGAGWSGSQNEGARRLAWDGQRWHLGADGPQATPRAGSLVLALDLGVWWLLRFSPADAAGRPTWLAIGRRGLEAPWHGLRCALHSPHDDDRA